MKKILVTMSLVAAQKNFLYAQTEDFDCEFIGCPPPELLHAAKNLEWLHKARGKSFQFTADELSAIEELIL